VADAFDSLTTWRSHREAHTVGEAVAELHERAGTQFDPLVVAALERGLARHGWEPPKVEPTLTVSTGRTFDHDDPESSDLMAGLADTGLANTGLAHEGLGNIRPSGTGLADSELAGSQLAGSELAGPGLARDRFADIERSQ